MTEERLRMEKQVLQTYLPANLVVFRQDYVLLPAKTNNGKIYTIRIDLDGFPERKPEAFVTQMLQTKNGMDMDSPSHEMHTLSSEHGFTQICHYNDSLWTNNVSLYKVYIKCRLWLEMYECHLVEGHNISYYLSAM